MTETERALRDALRAKGESYPVSPDAWARVRERAAAGRARRRRRTAPAVAAAAMAGVAATVLAPGVLTGDDPRPPAAVAAVPTTGPDDEQVAKALRLLCAGDRPSTASAGLLAAAGALEIGGGRGRLVAVGDGTGGLRVVRVGVAGGRLVCRSYAAAPDGGQRFVDYGGERGRGEVSWTGVVAPRATAFEALFLDGTRMRFACGETAACVQRVTVKGRVTFFTTKPRVYTPPKPGTLGRGVFNVFDTRGKMVEHIPFSAR